MGIYVKDMEMPTACRHGECNFACSAAYQTGLICIVRKQYVVPGDVPGDCPCSLIPSYDELLKAAQAMHTWIFLHSGNEELAYKACGLSDEMNAFLGYSGSLTFAVPVEEEDLDESINC